MLFESFITSKGIVDYILENNPSLKNDYEVVHSLRECIQDRDYIEFKEILEKLLSFSEELRQHYELYQLLLFPREELRPFL